MSAITAQTTAVSEQTNSKRLIVVVALIVAVFFFVSHDVRTSLYEEFAPWANESATVASGGNALKGSALAMLGAVGLYFLFQHDGRSFRRPTLFTALGVAYIAWAAISVLWSVDPGTTLRRVAVLVFLFVGALGIAKRFSPREILMIAWASSGMFVILGLLTEFACGTFTPWRGDYRFAGTVHPNTQGVQTAIFALASFLLANDESSKTIRNWLYTIAACGAMLLLFTKSRTSLSAFAFGASVCWLARADFRRLSYVVVFSTAVFSLGGFLVTITSERIQDRISAAFMLGRDDGDSEAFTGRGPIWEELSYYAVARPLCGHGYESFWSVDRIDEISDHLHWKFRESHNGYLETVLSVGFIGAGILFSFVLVGIGYSLKVYRKTATPLAGFILGMLCFGLVSALFESGMVGENYLTFVIGCGIVSAAFFGLDDEASLPSIVTRSQR